MDRRSAKDHEDLRAGNGMPDPERAVHHSPAGSDSACPGAQISRRLRNIRRPRLAAVPREILPEQLRLAFAAAPKLENSHLQLPVRLLRGTAAQRRSTCVTNLLKATCKRRT